MKVVRDLADLRRARGERRAAGRRLGLVPTMGALHRGHLQLVQEACRHVDEVAVSIFVNPMQFGLNEDLSRYLRDEAGDLEKLHGAGCDLIWMPSVDTMYPPEATTVIEVGGPAEGFEGAVRPGHFRGVATVCTKLFRQTGADLAVFGEKDWQQLQVVRRVVTDLETGVEIVGHATVREDDRLAFSSRNVRLSPDEHALAPSLVQVMRGTAREIADGGCPGTAIDAALPRLWMAGFVPDYLALVEPDTLRPWRANQGGEARLLAAAQLGHVMLLDNMALWLPG